MLRATSSPSAPSFMSKSSASALPGKLVCLERRKNSPDSRSRTIIPSGARAIHVSRGELGDLARRRRGRAGSGSRSSNSGTSSSATAVALTETTYPGDCPAQYAAAHITRRGFVWVDLGLSDFKASADALAEKLELGPDVIEKLAIIEDNATDVRRPTSTPTP